MSAAQLVEASSLARLPGSWPLRVVAGTALVGLAAVDLSGPSRCGKAAA